MPKSIPRSAPIYGAKQAANSGGLDMSSHNRADPPHGLPLSALHQRTVALQLAIRGQQQVLKGRGVYELDAELGHVLRIELPHEAGCEFVIVERSWRGEIQPGTAHGCDYLIHMEERASN